MIYSRRRKTIIEDVSIEDVLDATTEEFLKLIEDKYLRGKVRESMYFAGGCIYSLANDREIKDYDIFLDDRELLDELKKLDFWHCITDYALSYGKFQVVTKFYGNPDDVVGQFDFKHNMFYYKPYTHVICAVVEYNYLHSNELYFNEERARDIANVYLRLGKFLDRGMTISDEEREKIFSKTSPEEIEEVKNYYEFRTIIKKHHHFY